MIDWTIVLILWAVCAVAGYFIGQSRGANPLVWASAGLFLGPLGVLLALLRAKPERQ